jgi:hypothetical protein
MAATISIIAIIVRRINISIAATVLVQVCSQRLRSGRRVDVSVGHGPWVTGSAVVVLCGVCAAVILNFSCAPSRKLLVSGPSHT